MQEINAQKLMSDTKFFDSYSRWIYEENRYETWDEAVTRVMNMHRRKYADLMTPELEEYIQFAENAYKEKITLGSQRALQFGGEQIFKHETKIYNCTFTHASFTRFFQETMYMLLSGCGVGFSVQHQHIAKLPSIDAPAIDKAEVFVVPDSIEGWSDAFGVLFSSYIDPRTTSVTDIPFPEYNGVTVHFDLSEIRPRGAEISGGFKAPGPEGLERALEKCRKLLDQRIKQKVLEQESFSYESLQLRPIDVYDFTMHMSDAVLSGGVRRSATICIFSFEDELMMKAKTGDYYVKNAQRQRSNNSVALLRDNVTREQFLTIKESVKGFGEPGFVFLDDLDWGFNPCAEIGMRPLTVDGRTGFQMCNLTEINGGAITNLEILLRAAKAGSIMGTLQAGYTNFKYLSKETKEITDREALIGVSITGWMNNPEILFNEQYLNTAALLVKSTNRDVAKLININPAARTTTVKPSGNASVLLGCASGIHGEHSKRYFRNVQLTEHADVVGVIRKFNPKMIEKSTMSPNGTDVVVSYPITTPDTSIMKKDLLGVKQLEYVRTAQIAWVIAGTDKELCVDPRMTHNVSNTITVDDWDATFDYIYDNRKYFSGVSLLSASGDRAYAQAPFTEVFTSEEITTMYGTGALFASGLIVDGKHAFSNNLWSACNTVAGYGEDLTIEDSENVLMRDWVRRARKFADMYFNSNIDTMCNCLKDVHNLHKWETITRKLVDIDFTEHLHAVKFTEVDTLGAIGCAGGVCEYVL